MPQYRELRAKEKDFLSFCKNVELAVKVSLLPLELLDVDAVIIFSDILVPLEPMGINVRFEEGEGPHLEWDGNVKALRKITSKDTEFVNEIIKEVKRNTGSGACYWLLRCTVDPFCLRGGGQRKGGLQKSQTLYVGKKGRIP
jgi:uroporphyrinogen-III decarboxylase